MLPLNDMMDSTAPSILATVRDNDTSLWLHNKLGSNEPWTSGSISSQLNAEVLRNVKDCFIDLQTQVKLKFLLSFFHIPRRNIEEWRHELQEIIEVAQLDGEQWVSMMAEMMRKYATTNCLQTDINTPDDNARVYYELLQDLETELKRTEITSILPLECHYLNMDVLNQCIKSQKQQEVHFTVNKKPKSNALRAELYTRGIEAAEHSAKKIPAPTIPLRTRGMPRKMTDTTPLRGIPSNIPAGTRAPVAAQAQPRTPPRALPEKKGGIKVLDINEQPVGFSAKRRKKTLDTDELKKSLQSGSDTSGVENMETPDYAAGLGSDRATTPPMTPLHPPPTPASYPPPPTPQPYTTMPPTPSHSLGTPFGQTSVISDAPPPTPSAIPRYDGPPHIPNLSPTKRAYSPNAKPAQKELMEQAQEIFRNSNRATRPEKEHILKFMSGIKDNPCPELGNIVTIKLSEKQESVRQPSGAYLPYLVETHFQMNYNTGEWKVITKPPKLVVPTGNGKLTRRGPPRPPKRKIQIEEFPVLSLKEDSTQGGENFSIFVADEPASYFNNSKYFPNAEHLFYDSPRRRYPTRASGCYPEDLDDDYLNEFAYGKPVPDFRKFTYYTNSSSLFASSPIKLRPKATAAR